MEHASQQVILSVEEQRLLRSFVAANQRTRWQDWSYYGALSLILVSWLIGCQLLIRYLPAHLDARGLAICLRHPTLRHGIQWFPDGPGFFGLLRFPCACGTMFGFFFGVIALTCYVQQRHARRVSQILARVLPESAAGLPGSRSVHPSF